MVSGNTGDFKTLVAKILFVLPILLIWIDNSHKCSYCHKQHYYSDYNLYEASFIMH